MKKFVVLAAALVIGLGIASASFAASATDTETVTIRVIVTSGTTGIRIMSGAVVDLGTIAVGGTALFTNGNRVIVNNNGDTNVNLYVLASNFGPWALSTVDPLNPIVAINECRFLAVFTQWDSVRVAADFATNDLLYNVGNDGCDLFNHAVDGEDNIPAGQPYSVKGHAMTPTQDRSLHLRFDAPLATSAGLGVQQSSTLTINAVQY